MTVILYEQLRFIYSADPKQFNFHGLAKENDTTSKGGTTYIGSDSGNTPFGFSIVFQTGYRCWLDDLKGLVYGSVGLSMMTS